MGLYVAELAPHSPCYCPLPPGRATRSTRLFTEKENYIPVSPSTDNVVAWNTPVNVRSGDCFTVQEGQVHQLENTGSLPMIAIIVCPAAHIGHDRFIVKGAIPH